MRLAAACLGLAATASWIVARGHVPPPARLWAGAHYTRGDRDRAIRRGMTFLYDQIACNPQHFAAWGSDLLSAFDNIAATSLDPELRRMAWRMGNERAREWRRLRRKVPPNPDVNLLTDLIYGDDASKHLGAADPAFHAALAAASRRFNVYDYLGFDPAKEPPPSDLPAECPKCGLLNDRGATVCRRDGAKLTMQNPYDIFQDALIAAYSGDRCGITLGAHYQDVLRWLPTLRPYPARGTASSHTYYAGIYTATHVIYTYNHYSLYRVSPGCFPQEFEHLQANLRQAQADHDPETMGEYLDSLRAFGLGLEDNLVRTGFDFLLSTQNSDGSWGSRGDPDIYGRYHPTWTAIDGLRDYRWDTVLPCPGF